MKKKAKSSINTTTNKTNNQKRTRNIDGIRAYYIVGIWYCDWNYYQHVKEQQGIRANVDVFCSWCEKWDLSPTG